MTQKWATSPSSPSHKGVWQPLTLPTLLLNLLSTKLSSGFFIGGWGERSCSPINFSASNCLASLELRLGFVAEYPPLHPLCLRHCACLLRGCQHTQRSRGVCGHKETAASVRILKRISCPLLPTPSSLSVSSYLFSTTPLPLLVTLYLTTSPALCLCLPLCPNEFTHTRRACRHRCTVVCKRLEIVQI